MRKLLLLAALALAGSVNAQTISPPPGGSTTFANPTATVGTSAANGSASTAMRSDAAPAVDQTMSPTWTGQHIFQRATNSAATFWNFTNNSTNYQCWAMEGLGTTDMRFRRWTNSCAAAAASLWGIDKSILANDTFHFYTPVGVDTTIQIGTETLTTANGEVGMAKITASGSAPGAAGLKFAVVCGTNGGSAKIIAYAGTSTTPTTVIDNVGAGVTGC